MSERTQERARGASEVTGLPSLELGDPDALRAEFRDVASRAWSEEADADRLNELMGELGAVLGAEGAAELLRELLSQRGVAHAEDSSGRSCRARAVEALLGLGHPWAFTVSPEDLKWYRREGRRLTWPKQLVIGGALLAALQQAWTFGDRMLRTEVLSEVATEVAAAAALGVGTAVLAGMVMWRPARRRSGRSVQTALLLAGVASGTAAALGVGMGTAWLTALVASSGALWSLSGEGNM